MFRKCLPFFLMVFMINATAVAQMGSDNAAYKVSKPYKVFDFDHNFYVAKNDEIVLLKFIRSQCIIQRFNAAKPQHIAEHRYDDFFPNGFRIEDFKEIDGKYYFFYSLFNKDKKCEEVIAQEVDFEKAEFVNQPKIVLSAAGKPRLMKRTYYLHRNRTAIETGYTFIQPKDKSSLLIHYSTILGKDDGAIKINLIDKNLGMVYAKSIPFDVKSDAVLSSLVGVEGHFYFVSKKTIKGDKTDTYKTDLNTLPFNSKDLVTTTLPLESAFANELWLRDANDGIVCGGFTGDFDSSKKAFFSLKKSVTNNSKGLMVFKVSRDGKPMAVFKHGIPGKAMNFYTNQPDVDYFENAYLHDFEVTKTGDIILIGEQFVPIEENNSGYAIYRDLLICKITKNGELAFAKRLPKLQASANEMQPFSFKTFLSDDYLYFAFIDDVKNLDAKTTRVQDASGDLILSRASLKDGEIRRKFILNIGIGGNNLNKFSVDRFYKTRLNSFCFDAYKKDKEDVMVTVEF